MQAAEVESVIHSLIGVTSVVRAEHEMNIGDQRDKYHGYSLVQVVWSHLAAKVAGSEAEEE